jgi:hypothetical protein
VLDLYCQRPAEPVAPNSCPGIGAPQQHPQRSLTAAFTKVTGIPLASICHLLLCASVSGGCVSGNTVIGIIDMFVLLNPFPIIFELIFESWWGMLTSMMRF